MKTIVLISSLLITGISFSQSISRQVIGSTGSLNNSTISSSSVGPSIVNTVTDGTVTLTQGFQQPANDILHIEVITTLPTCEDFTGGMIDVIASGCTNEFTFVWNTGDSSASIEDLPPGTYSFTVTSGTCTYTESVMLALDENCNADIPNVVTANGDGANDVLVIPEFYFDINQENEVSIFNRWGHEIWTASNYDNQVIVWMGQDKSGNDLPAGTYYYSVAQGESSYQGFIELLR